MFGVNSVKLYTTVKYVLYIFLIVILLFKNTKKFNRTSLAFLFLSITNIILTMLFNYDLLGGYIYQIITLILSFLLVKEIEFKSFSLLFCKFLYFLSFISITIYFLVLINPTFLTIFPVIINTAGYKCYNLFLCTVYEGDSYSMLRNTGIFREPGVYMIYLNFAIIFSLFFNETLNKKYLIIYCIAIITTMSTAGIIITGFIIFMSIFFDSKRFTKFEKYGAFILIIMCVCYFIYNIELSNKVFGKLDSSSNDISSTMSRIVSFFIPFIIFFQYPIFGSGLSLFSKQFPVYSSAYFGIPFLSEGTATNTLANKFATYGLLFGFIFIYALFRFSVKVMNNRNRKVGYFIFIILLLMFSNEDMRYSLIFNMIIFYGIKPLKLGLKV